MNTALYETYVQILHEELVPAMGCTEPIAVAYAGALARQTLGTLPERIELTVSGNIIKNVKSVIVPHTGGRKGPPPAGAGGGRRAPAARARRRTRRAFARSSRAFLTASPRRTARWDDR